MPLYEVKKGHIPKVAFGSDEELGWLRLGPETEKLWSFPRERSTDFYNIGLVVLSSHVSTDPQHTAHMSHLRASYGENPIEFQGVIPVDEHNFHDIAISGLLYRSGFFRGAVQIDNLSDPSQIATRVEEYIQTHPLTFETKLAR